MYVTCTLKTTKKKKENPQQQWRQKHQKAGSGSPTWPPQLLQRNSVLCDPMWTFHISRITCFVSCVCYLSLSSIHTAACVSAPSLVMAEEHSTIRRHHTLCLQLLMGLVPPPISTILWLELLLTFGCEHLFEHLLSVLWAYPSCGIAGSYENSI